MHEAQQLPDLTFPMVTLGPKETPWSLKPLLYKGGAAENVTQVETKINTGELGAPQFERLSLVQLLHEAITGKLTSGGSRATQAGIIDTLRAFFTWAENANHPLILETVTKTYLHWADSLLHRVRFIKDLKEDSAYNIALRLSNTLGLVLLRDTPLIQLSRLTKPPQKKTVLGVKADKQNLEWTFLFGFLLQDVCDGLPLSAIWGALPVRIHLRSGGILEEWSGLRPAGAILSDKRDTPIRRFNAKKSAATRTAYINDRTLKTRHSLVNLRIEAELLMFIGQTGMNLGQAASLKLRNFYFSSDIDGYKVKDRKNRRGGEVLFEIFKEYRPHFERYLDWRREIFPKDERLFPLVTESRLNSSSPRFWRMREACEKLGLTFVPASALRNTRINWLLRRSGDPDLTAEMAQHTKETLLTVYEAPSLQRAMTETMRFWAQSDPTLPRTIPVAPGECDGKPVPMKNMPTDASPPDCIRASGCLWCEHHRDVDSQDYVWALGCFRHLKVIELSKFHEPENGAGTHPAEHAVSRISDKLHWFRESNEFRRGWVEEALIRIEEGNYHPDWRRLIEDVEGVAL